MNRTYWTKVSFIDNDNRTFVEWFVKTRQHRVLNPSEICSKIRLVYIQNRNSLAVAVGIAVVHKRVKPIWQKAIFTR